MMKRPIRATKIEIAKTAKSVHAISPELGEEFLRSLEPDKNTPDLKRSIAGLREEDEFAVMCKLTGTANLIVDLGQRPLIPSTTIIPDFLISFEPKSFILGVPREPENSRLCLVEVKSTDRDELKVSGSLLARRREFASQMGLPLVFAVRFTRFGLNAFWVMKWDQDTTARSLRVRTTDLLTSASRFLWDDYFLYVSPNTRMVRISDSSSSSGPQTEFGQLVATRLVTADSDETFEGEESFFLSAMLDALQFEVERTESLGTITQQVFCPTVAGGMLSDVIWRINHLVSDESGNRLFDSSAIVAHADTDEFTWLIGREFVERLCRWLVDLKVLYYIGMGEREDVAKTFDAFFRRS